MLDFGVAFGTILAAGIFTIIMVVFWINPSCKLKEFLVLLLAKFLPLFIFHYPFSLDITFAYYVNWSAIIIVPAAFMAMFCLWGAILFYAFRSIILGKFLFIACF